MNWKKFLLPIVLIAAFFTIKAILNDEKRVDLIMVNGGSFQMGDTNGNFDVMPMHNINLSSFYISKYEVTNIQYAEFLNENGNQIEDGVEWIDLKHKLCKINQNGENFKVKKGFENHPVLAITWYGARAYCEWKGGRLPTEAEWEYAARGGKESNNFNFSGSNFINEVAWAITTSNGQIHEVGEKKSNELGIYDMSGNAWEWCSDKYNSNYYKLSPSENPQGPPVGKHRVVRGGSYLSFGEDNLKVSSRVSANPKEVGSYSFRVVFNRNQIN